MNRTHLAFAALLITGAALGSTWLFQRKQDTLAQQEREIRFEIVRLTSRLDSLRADQAEEAAKRASPRMPMGPTTTTRQAQVPTAEELQARAVKVSERRRNALLNSPDLQVLYEQSSRAHHQAEFAALFERLNLTSEERSILIGALVAWQLAMRDAEAVMKQQGLARDDPALKAVRAEAEETLARALESVLGPDPLEITKEFTRLSAARRYVTAHGGLMARIGHPLSFEQLEQLTSAFAEVSPNRPPNPNKLSSEQWQNVNRRAEVILTPEQWQVFSTATPSGEGGGRWESAMVAALESAYETE